VAKVELKTERFAMTYRLLSTYAFVRPESEQNCSLGQINGTIRDAFGRAKPNAEYARLYAAAVARRQADQIYNLSLTRTATVIPGER
jgi:hypothetical protein